MKLKILLPSKIFSQQSEVLRIVAESYDGSFGILPRRLDCVACLAPGILTYETAKYGEQFVAVDTGLLVKNGDEVLVSVRRAIGNVPLAELQAKVKSEFLNLDEQESELQLVLSKLEGGFLKQISGFSRA